MAAPRVIRSVHTGTTSNQTQLQAASPAFEVGQVRIVWCNVNGGSRTFSTSTPGWFTTGAYSGNNPSQEVFYNHPASTSDPWPLMVQSGAATAIQLVSIVLDGVVTTGNPVDAHAQTGGNVGEIQTPSFSTTGKDRLVIHGASTNTQAAPLLGLSSMAMLMQGDAQAITLSLYRSFQQPAGLVVQHDLMNGNSSRASSVLSAAFTPAAGAGAAGHVHPANPPSDIVTPLYMRATNAYYGGSLHQETPYDPTLGTGGIGELEPGQTTTYTTLPNGSYSPYLGVRDADSRPFFTRYNHGASGAYGYPHVHGVEFLGGARDYSGKVISLSIVNLGYYGLSRYDQGGYYWGFQTGGTTPTGSRVWKPAAYDTQSSPVEAIFPYQIGVDRPGYVGDFGTFDASSITGFVWGNRVTNSNLVGGMAYCHVLNDLWLVGGHDDSPCTFADAEDHTVNAAALRTVQSHFGQGEKTFYLAQPIRIGGDANWPTYFDSQNQSIEVPPRYAEGDLRVNSNIGDSTYPITIDATDEDLAIYVRGGAWNMQGQDFVIETGASRSVPDSFESLTVIDAGAVRLRNIGSSRFAGLTFLSCPELQYDAGTEMSGGITVAETIGAQAITVTSQAELNELANWTFDDNAIAVTITGEHAALTHPGGATYVDNITTINYTGTQALTLAVPASTTGITQGNVAGNVTVETSATINVANLTIGDWIWLYHVEGDTVLVDEAATATSQQFAAVVPDGDTIRSRFARYGGTWKRDEQSDIPVLNAAVSIFANIELDPFRVEDDNATFIEFNIDGATGLVEAWFLDSTLQKAYDACGQWANDSSNMQYAAPLIGQNPALYELGLVNPGGASWDFESDGVKCRSETIQLGTTAGGTITVTNGGLFGDLTGVKWDVGGALYLARLVDRQVQDVDTNTPQPGATVTVWDTATGNERAYGYDSLAVGAETTDVSGNCRFYAVYQIDAVAHVLQEWISLYEYQVSKVPIANTGTAIGSAASPEVTRLVTDPFTTLPDPLVSVTGVDIKAASFTIAYGSNNLSDTQDYCKAALAGVADVDPGVAGYRLLYQEGDWLLSNNGSVYVQLANWTSQQVVDGSDKLSKGTIELDTPGVVPLALDDLTIRYMFASTVPTYNHRTQDITGTMTLTTAGALVVSCEFDPAVVVSNQEPGNITVDQSQAEVFTAPNLIDGTVCRLENTTQGTELDLSTVTGGNGYSQSYTVGPGEEVEVDDILTLFYAYHSGVNYMLPGSGGSTAGTGGISVIDTQTPWLPLESWGIDGSTVTGLSFDIPRLNIDLNRPTGLVTKKDVVSWWAYQLTQADGIRFYWDAYTVLSEAEVRVNVGSVNLQLRNNGGPNTTFTDDDVSYYRSDSSNVYFVLAGDNGLYMNYYGVPVVVETGGTSLTPSQEVELTTAANPLTSHEIEPGVTWLASERVVRSSAAGPSQVDGDPQRYKYTDPTGTVVRIDAVTNAKGERVTVTTDAT